MKCNALWDTCETEAIVTSNKIFLNTVNDVEENEFAFCFETNGEMIELPNYLQGNLIVFAC